MPLNDIDFKLFVLSKLKGIGPAALTKIASLDELKSRSIEDCLYFFPKVREGLGSDNTVKNAHENANRELDEAEKRNVKIVSVLDDNYPELLSETRDRPFFLYIQGKLHHNPRKSVAIIGTREPTAHGKITCERITEMFVGFDWSIVSGLAFGCDAIAHEEALVCGGHTVAVLAHGLHTIAPKKHTRLAQEILEKGGALVTEYGFTIEARGPLYVKRDKIQAGLSAGVIMIQSDKEGGSMHASRAAIEYGRILGVPFPTNRDQANQEKKIESNLILSEPTSNEASVLLQCPPSATRNVFIIRTKDDYPDLISKLEQTAFRVKNKPAQAELS